MKGFFSFWRSSSKAQKSAFSLVLLLGVVVGVSVFFLNLNGIGFGHKNPVSEPFSVPKASASPAVDQLCGFAWMGTSESPSGSMGSGWISLNSKDCDTNDDGMINPASGDNSIPGCPICTTAGCAKKYNVSIDNNRRLNGYAWSSNIGWLKFGDGSIVLSNGTIQDDTSCGLASCPLTNYPSANSQNGDSYSNQPARIQSSNGNAPVDVYGWARFCAGTLGGDCTSANALSSDWDGWVALAPDNNNATYRLQYNPLTNRFFGWSWGGGASNTTGATTSPVGWIKWDAINDHGVQYCFVPTVNVSMDARFSNGTSEFTQSTTTLSATPTLSAVSTPAGLATEFSFSCDPNLGLPFSSWITHGTDSYSYTGCTYPIGQGLLTTDAPYSPQVVARRQQSNGSYLYATTSADLIVHRPPQPNDLGAVCSAVPTHTQVHGNIVWQVQLTTPGAAGDTYNYDFEFADGQGPTAINNSSSTVVTVTRTYNTTGAKLLTTYITDNTSNRTGQCNTHANITVNPNVTEF